jgi:hypothetical protein
MKKRVAGSTQKRNLKHLHKAYKGNGDSILGEGSFLIMRNNDYGESFKNAKLELGYHHTPEYAYIKVECAEEDCSNFDLLGLKQQYYLDEVTLRYEEVRDYQYTTRALLIKPIDAKETIKFKLK